MDLIWLKLTAAGPWPAADVPLVTDILWSNARPEDRVEHISISADGDPRVLIVALFFRADSSGVVSAAECALRLARAAIATSPTLMGWSVRLDDRGDLAVAPESD